MNLSTVRPHSWFASSWSVPVDHYSRQRKKDSWDLISLSDLYVTYYSIATQLILLHILYWYEFSNSVPYHINFLVLVSLHTPLSTSDSFLISFSIPRCTTQDESLLRILWYPPHIPNNPIDASSRKITKAWGNQYLPWAWPSPLCAANWWASPGSRCNHWWTGRFLRRRWGGTTTTRGTRRPATRWRRGGAARGCCTWWSTPWYLLKVLRCLWSENKQDRDY